MIRNSLVVSLIANPEVAGCADIIISNSALEMMVPGNTVLGTMMDSSWFSGFFMGEYRLSGSHPAAIDTAAVWMTGDPTTDFQGDPRPTVDGSPDFAGADVVP
jgi:hypothetical protein